MKTEIEFEWLKETNDLITDATEALFENNGVAEKGIVLITPMGDIALTISELKQIIEDLEEHP